MLQIVKCRAKLVNSNTVLLVEPVCEPPDFLLILLALNRSTLAQFRELSLVLLHEAALLVQHGAQLGNGLASGMLQAVGLSGVKLTPRLHRARRTWRT